MRCRKSKRIKIEDEKINALERGLESCKFQIENLKNLLLENNRLENKAIQQQVEFNNMISTIIRRQESNENQIRKIGNQSNEYNNLKLLSEEKNYDKRQDLLNAEDIKEYLNYLGEIKNKSLIIMSVKDTCGYGMTEQTLESMMNLGIKSNLMKKHNYGYIAVISRGEVLFDKLSELNGTIEYSEVIENIYVYVKSSPYKSDNVAQIRLSGWMNCAVNSRGLNIVVLDLDSKKLIDSACFDTHLNINRVVRKEDMIYELFNDVERQVKKVQEEIETLSKKEDIVSIKSEMIQWGILRKNFDDDLSSKKDFFMKMPKASGMLLEVQTVNEITLKIFDKICRRNGITYWLSFGALLGAIRHKGFIPWDDDIDVCVMREDLEKISIAFKDNPILEQINFINVSGTNICHKLHYRKKNIPCDLDIFVYDYCEYINDDIILKQDQLKKEMISEITEKRDNKSEHYIQLVMNKYMNLAEKELKITSKEKASGIIWGIDNFRYGPAKKSNVKLDYIFPLIEVELNGNKYYAPNNTEEYLSKMYGDIYSIPDDIISHKHFDLEKIDLYMLQNLIKEAEDYLNLLN